MNSRKYWERRAAQDMYDRMGTAEDSAAEMNAAIRQTSAYLEKEVKAVMRGMQSFGISEAEAKNILNAAGDGTALQRLRKSAQQVGDPEKREALLNAINSAGAYRYRITRIEELNRDINRQCRELYKTENRHITSALRNVAEDSYYREIFSIQKGTGLGFSFSRFSRKDVDRILRANWAGGNYSQRIWKDVNGMTARLKNELLVSMLSGRSGEKTARIFQERFGVNAYCARRLVRTESAYVANAAQSRAYGEAGIERYRFVATLDSRTCECCAALDGKVFELAKAKPGTNYPPMHPFCRSTTIADFGDEELSGLERRAKDKDGNTVRVPAGMTYEDWRREFVEGEPGRTYGNVKPDADSARRKAMAAEMNKPQTVTSASSFVPAKTVQEAQEYAQKLGVKYADYSKFTTERANNLNMAISTLPDDSAPVLVTDLQKYTKVTGAPLGRAQNNAYAVTVAPYEINLSAVNINAPSIEGSGEAIVALNTRSFKSIDSLTKTKQEVNEKYVQRYGHGWHFNTDGAVTDFHECGHVYQNKYGLPTAFGADAARWQRETGLGILKSTNEAWAEAYGAYYTHREDLPDYIRRYFDPGEWKESSGSKALSFDEWQKKLGNALDKSGGSGIIEMTRRKSGVHRRTNARNLQIIDKPTYNKLTSDFLKHDGIIIRGEEAAKHLGDTHSASYLPSLNTAFIRDDATISEVLEEMYHAEQDRKNMFGDTLTAEVWLRREIDAQKHLLSLSEKYKIPQEEIEVTKGNLEQYEAELKKLLGGE